VYEGVAFAVRDILERSQTATGLVATELCLSGGPSRSAYWSQLKADVTGLSARPMTVTDAGCLGAAILGALGAGGFGNLAQAATAMAHPAAVYEPRPEMKPFYDERFVRWRGTYPALKSLYP
jgi:xylulokinase